LNDARAETVSARPEEREALEVKRARAGDAAVWSRWFDDYYALLFRYAAARLGDREEAADIASQVFLEAMRGIGRYNYRGRPVLAWFYGIAANLIAARLRKARRLVRRESLPEEGVDTTDGQIQNIALAQALQKLTDDQREAVTLTFVLGLPVKEAAALLGKKQATVYSLQAKAMSNLRKLLAPATEI
jgi:RNA polymerase sigma-70 factor (ECF subfamily)